MTPFSRDGQPQLRPPPLLRLMTDSLLSGPEWAGRLARAGRLPNLLSREFSLCAASSSPTPRARSATIQPPPAELRAALRWRGLRGWRPSFGPKHIAEP